MTPKMTALRDELAKEQGDNHACPVIRSMYPSKSRGEMSREFAQLYSLGFDACYEIMLKEVEETLVGTLDWIVPKVHQAHHSGDISDCKISTCIEYQKYLKQWRDFAGGGE
jgi:hypothetical protein